MTQGQKILGGLHSNRAFVVMVRKDDRKHGEYQRTKKQSKLVLSSFWSKSGDFGETSPCSTANYNRTEKVGTNFFYDQR